MGTKGIQDESWGEKQPWLQAGSLQSRGLAGRTPRTALPRAPLQRAQPCQERSCRLWSIAPRNMLEITMTGSVHCCYN